jgi:hypothetical protein
LDSLCPPILLNIQDIAVVTQMAQHVISPTKTKYLASLKISDTVNVYPQAINRDCCDKNHHSGVQTHWDTQIISQPTWAIPANKIRPFYFQTLLFHISI